MLILIKELKRFRTDQYHGGVKFYDWMNISKTFRTVSKIIDRITADTTVITDQSYVSPEDCFELTREVISYIDNNDIIEEPAVQIYMERLFPIIGEDIIEVSRNLVSQKKFTLENFIHDTDLLVILRNTYKVTNEEFASIILGVAILIDKKIIELQDELQKTSEKIDELYAVTSENTPKREILCLSQQDRHDRLAKLTDSLLKITKEMPVKIKNKSIRHLDYVIHNKRSYEWKIQSFGFEMLNLINLIKEVELTCRLESVERLEELRKNYLATVKYISESITQYKEPEDGISKFFSNWSLVFYRPKSLESANEIEMKTPAEISKQTSSANIFR